MLKILLWFVSKDTRYVKSAINILEHQHNGVEIVGDAVGENISLLDKDFDIILVAGARLIGMSKVNNAARQLNLPEEKLLGDWVVCIPGFTLKKYRHLQRSRLSIFSMNCFGGLISNSLGLPFRSPFVNLFLSGDDFVNFARIPRIYLEEKLDFKENGFYEKGNHDYPIFKIGNIVLNMIHYYDSNDAITKWNERKQRINWYNLLVIMATENEEILEQFDSLPYGKKICFVPFQSDFDSAWYINRKFSNQALFTEVANDFARAIIFYYDPFDMLLYGKKTQLIDM